MREWFDKAPAWLETPLMVVAVVLGAILAHGIVLFVLRRAARRTKTTTDDLLIARLQQPVRWLLIAIALFLVEPVMDLSRSHEAIWQGLAGLLVPGLIGWLAIALLGALNDIVQAKADISVEDNLRARRRRTKAGILYRIAICVLVLITFCLMLMSIPAVRNIGVTLIASAGLAGLAVGAAAQPALKNLIAGIQMAFTEPIRLDDVVIIAGEWGKIEEIRLTYVVVKVWDERRLVVPVSKFLEESFQNWTRETSQLLGTAFFHLDPAADVPRLRAHLTEVVKGNPLWDGRVVGLQVTETYADRIELRALVSAKDATRQFDLRCDVREAMMAFIVKEMPEALVRQRGQIVVEEQAERPALPAG
jgi:small-conductance mechanosensitive channel